MDFSFPARCALFCDSRQREIRHIFAALLFAVTLYDLHDWFPEQDMLIVDCLIAVVVPKQPVMIPGLFPYLLEEIRERVRLIARIDGQGKISWGTVGYDVIYRPIMFFETMPSPGRMSRSVCRRD